MNQLVIDVVSDVVCPWCYIGKRHLEAALREWRGMRAENTAVNVSIRWHPFQLNPDLPSEGVDRKAYLEQKFGGPERAREIYARVGAAGRAVGLALNFDAIERQPNTLAAHTLIDFAQSIDRESETSSETPADAQSLTDRIVEALFHAYFVDGRFIGDIELLANVADSFGLDRDQVRTRLTDVFALDRIASADAGVRAQGVSGVPFFVFNQRLALSGAQPPATLIEAIEQSRSTAAV